jgi:hypothetical protein
VFLRSARVASDGKPVVQGVGARATKRGVRVDVMHASEPVRKGRLRVSLHDGTSTHKLTVLVTASIARGAYQNTTLEVAE